MKLDKKVKKLFENQIRMPWAPPESVTIINIPPPKGGKKSPRGPFSAGKKK